MIVEITKRIVRDGYSGCTRECITWASEEWRPATHRATGLPWEETVGGPDTVSVEVPDGSELAESVTGEVLLYVPGDPSGKTARSVFYLTQERRR